MNENISDLLKHMNESLDILRPYFEVDGGNITVMDIDDQGVVKVQLHGNCMSCSQKSSTIKSGVEHTLKQKFPQVTSVEEL
jgi:Fe-S cluster biogenesis protein NfuA